MYVVILLKEISPLKNIHMCTDKYIRVFLYISYLFLAKCQTNYRYLSDNFFICLNFFLYPKVTTTRQYTIGIFFIFCHSF